MVTVDTTICVACGGCIDLCPATALRMIDDTVSVDQEKCTECAICVKVCPLNAPNITDRQ